MSFFSAFTSYRPGQNHPPPPRPEPPVPVHQEPLPHNMNTDTHNEKNSFNSNPPPPFNPMDSIILEKEKWTPYKNLLIFLSSVLLWEKPVILIILSIFTHLVLWYGARLIMRSHFSIILGIFLWLLFVSDYLMKLSGNSWSNLLQKFPGPTNPETNRDYDEVVRQYVTARRAFYSFIQLAKQQRKENHHQFTISALFFSLIFCTILYFTRTFLLFYVIVFSCLLGPGLVKHNVPSRVWEFLQPHLIQVYQSLNSSLAQVLNPQTKPAAAGSSNPTPPPVNGRPHSLRNQFGSENLAHQPPMSNSPLRPSQMPYPSPSSQSPLYRNNSSTFTRPTSAHDYPPPPHEYHSMPSGPRADGSNRAPYSSDSHVSQRNTSHTTYTHW